MVSMGVVIRMAMHTGIQMPMTMRTVMTTRKPRLRTTATTNSTMSMALLVRTTTTTPMVTALGMIIPTPDAPTSPQGPNGDTAP